MGFDMQHHDDQDETTHLAAPLEQPGRASRAGRVKFVFFLLFFAVTLASGLFFLPRMVQLATQEGRAHFVASVQDMGALGVLFCLLLQIAQVVSFIIPGEFFEVMGGALFGTFGGFAICMAGVTLGSIIIFLLARALGYEVIENLLSRKNFRRLQFLKKEGRLEAVVFWLFFIPGTPKDALTYFVPFTRLSLVRFLLLSSLARIPSILSSTLVGSNLAQGNFVLSIFIYALVGVMGLVGMWYNNKLLDRKNEQKN